MMQPRLPHEVLRPESQLAIVAARLGASVADAIEAIRERAAYLSDMLRKLGTEDGGSDAMQSDAGPSMTIIRG